MHVPFRIRYRNNLIDKKDSCTIPRTPSWDDRNCSYGHQLYPSDLYMKLNMPGTCNHPQFQFEKICCTPRPDRDSNSQYQW
jgi:hypothetical protein